MQTTIETNDLNTYINQIILGDCIDVLKKLPTGSVDLVVTDPPYLVKFKSRDGRSILNDHYSDWLLPAFTQISRVLKRDSFCVSFYGWPQADKFISAWRQADFRPVGHIVWTKPYTSKTGFLKGCHEAAYLLAKGRPALPIGQTLPDVLPWQYTGNRLHPNQKPVMAIEPLVRAFSKPGDIVLDPFCGSGTTAEAARKTGRRYIGIEKDERYHRIAAERLFKE